MISRLKKRRFELGLSQYDIEKICGISQSRFSLAERGYRVLSLGEKKKIARILQMEMHELFPDNEEERKERN